MPSLLPLMARVVALFAKAQRLLESIVAPLHAPRQINAGNYKRQCRNGQKDFQSLLSESGCFAEGVGKSRCQRRDFGIDALDFCEDRRQRLRCHIACSNLRAQLFAGGMQVGNQRIGLGPQLDCFIQEADATETPKQPNHAIDIVGMIFSGEKSITRDDQIGRGFFQLDTHDMVALGNRDGGQECVIVGVVVRLRISVQMIDGFFLRLRPDALTADVGAGAGNDLDTRGSEQQQYQNRDQERPDDQPQARVHMHPAIDVIPASHDVSPPNSIKISLVPARPELPCGRESICKRLCLHPFALLLQHASVDDARWITFERKVEPSMTSASDIVGRIPATPPVHNDARQEDSHWSRVGWPSHRHH